MRTLLGIFVLAVALPMAAQELPTAPSAAQRQAQQAAFRAQMDAPPNLTHRLSAGDTSQVFGQDSTSAFQFSAAAASAGFARPANGLQPRVAVGNQRSGHFLNKVLSPLLASNSSEGKGQQTFGGRIMGALSQLADIDDEPDTAPANYSQSLGMAVSDMIANAYQPLDAHGIRHTGGGFGAHVSADTGIVRGFLPGVKQLLLGRKVLPERQREALTWRTRTRATAPDSVH